MTGPSGFRAGVGSWPAWPSPAPWPRCRSWRRRCPTRATEWPSGITGRRHGLRQAGRAEQYAALLDQARLGSSTHRTTVSVALDLRAAARAVKAAGGGLAGGGCGAAARTWPAWPTPCASAGLTVGAWLGECELAAMIRGAYEPVRLPGRHREPERHVWAVLALWRLSEHWDCLHHDSAWSSVLWICEWPRIDVPPDFLHPLIFAAGVRRTLSLIARPLASEVALRQIRKEKTEAVADQAQKARVGQIADLSDAQEYQDLLDRERSVIAGHTDVEFSGLDHRHRPHPGPARRRPGGDRPGRRPGRLRGAAALRPPGPGFHPGRPCRWPAAAF